MEDQDKKFRIMPKKELILEELDTAPVVQETAERAPAATPSPNNRAAQSAVGTMASGGSTMDIASSGLMASGNPYAMAGGAGLAVISANQKRKDADRAARYQREQDRINRQQQALGKLMDISSGLKRL